MKNLCFMFTALAVSALLLCTACGGGGGGAPAPAPAADGATSGTGTGTGGSGTAITAEKGLAATVADSRVFIKGRSIEISPTLWVSPHEVTQGEYKEVMGSTPAKDYGVGDNYPVYYVSWYDALVYCNKRSMAEGKTPCYTINDSTDPAVWGDVPTTNDTDWNKASCNFNASGYRLPTEAEWEYAARGGNLTNSGQTTYAGSNDVVAVAWCGGNSDHKTHTVKTKTANKLGLHDMSGNVREWCWDWRNTITTTTPATGSVSGSGRVFRGGCWIYSADVCAVSFRNYVSPYYRSGTVGFRVVRTAE